jgi:hypothetical protein
MLVQKHERSKGRCRRKAHEGKLSHGVALHFIWAMGLRTTRPSLDPVPEGPLEAAHFLRERAWQGQLR